MNKIVPSTGSPAEWNAAYYRLEDYLRALHISNKISQNQIILRVLERAAARHQQTPETSPTTLALQEVWQEMELWFQEILPTPPKFLAAGAVSLWVTDAVEKWPDAFLSPEIPPDFANALKECEVQAGPDLNLSSMVPRPLDASPLEDVASAEKPKRTALIFPALLFASALATLLLLLSR